MKFLYLNGKLNRERINKVFNLAIDQHDAMQEHILQLIKEMVEFLSYSDLEYVMDKMNVFDLRDTKLAKYKIYQNLIKF